jgi:hypothetical protein
MEYKNLQNELTALIKFQADSGECVKMTLQHAKDYDLRHQRIEEIRYELCSIRRNQWPTNSTHTRRQ